MEIFVKKGIFHSNFRVTISGGCATSKYRNLEVAQPLGYDIQKL